MHQGNPATPLSVADIQEFRALLRAETGKEYTAGKTQLVVERLLRLYRRCETAGKEPRQDGTARLREPGRPFTSRELETEATLALRTLQVHLSSVEQRPSTWRWAIVSLQAALKYGLQACLVAAEPSKQPTEDLPTLFRRGSEIMPELPLVAEAIEQLDAPRWKYLAKQLSTWPLRPDHLPDIVVGIVRVVQRLRLDRNDTLVSSLLARAVELACAQGHRQDS